jgi:hypothetical protein
LWLRNRVFRARRAEEKQSQRLAGWLAERDVPPELKSDHQILRLAGDLIPERGLAGFKISGTQPSPRREKKKKIKLLSPLPYSALRPTKAKSNTYARPLKKYDRATISDGRPGAGEQPWVSLIRQTQRFCLQQERLFKLDSTPPSPSLSQPADLETASS